MSDINFTLRQRLHLDRFVRGGLRSNLDRFVHEMCKRDPVVEAPEVIGPVIRLGVVGSFPLNVAEFVDGNPISVGHVTDC